MEAVIIVIANVCSVNPIFLYLEYRLNGVENWEFHATSDPYF